MKKTMKKLTVALLTVLLLLQNVVVFAEYYPDYSGNGSEIDVYIRGFSSETGIFEYGTDIGGKYHNIYFEQMDLSKHKIENLYFDNRRLQMILVDDIDCLATRKDALLFLYDTIFSEYEGYMDIKGDPDKFVDMEEYQKYRRVVAFFSGLVNDKGQSALSGYETKNGLELKLDNNITRAEFTKIVLIVNDTIMKIEKSRGAPDFQDISGHWAEEDIKEAYELGFIDGTSDTGFDADEKIIYEHVMRLVFKVCSSGLYITRGNFDQAVKASGKDPGHFILKEYQIIK